MKLIPRKTIFDDSFDFFNMPMLKENEEMKTDIYEKNGKYHLEMDLPGVDKKDIDVHYGNGYLTISASKKEEKEEKGDYVRRERFYGEYKRSFYVGDIDENDIKANYDNGMLKVSFPKEEMHTNRKQISIE